jgi:hypothetical protein
MKVSHWTITNGSGMHRVAESLVTAEQARGLDSALADPTMEATWEYHVDSDIHVVHTHLPNKLRKMVTKPLRIVWVGHGTPDHVFQSACEEFDHGGYGHGDPIGLTMEWVKTAHARVTFWDRHAWIYDRMLSTGARKTDVIPMGVDTAFWKDGSTAGKFSGEPSVFTAENPHYIKWPYDLFTAWGDVSDEFPEAKLHAVYLPRDMHRAFFPWFNQMGAFWNAYVSAGTYPKEWLKNAFQSTDYTIGLVRYGDLNHLSMQANAAGAQTISYPGNPYSDFWVAEGDQRGIAKELIEIFKGDRAPRDKTPVPDIADTITALTKVYEAIL